MKTKTKKTKKKKTVIKARTNGATVMETIETPKYERLVVWSDRKVLPGDGTEAISCRITEGRYDGKLTVATGEFSISDGIKTVTFNTHYTANLDKDYADIAEWDQSVALEDLEDTLKQFVKEWQHTVDDAEREATRSETATTTRNYVTTD